MMFEIVAGPLITVLVCPEQSLPDLLSAYTYWKALFELLEIFSSRGVPPDLRGFGGRRPQESSTMNMSAQQIPGLSERVETLIKALQIENLSFA